METFFKIAGLVTVGIIVILGLGILFAYSVMWLVNYLFAASFLAFVFGGPLTVWKAWGLSILASFLFKSTGSTSSTSDK